MAQRLTTAGNSLSGFPERGRTSSGGMRELAVIYPYIIRYRVRSDVVEIIRIKHGAQRPGP
jgi:toxin ParE1/3/4